MLSNRKAVASATIVMMVAMASFLALTPAYYVMQARIGGYRYHDGSAHAPPSRAAGPIVRVTYMTILARSRRLSRPTNLAERESN